MFKNKNNKNIDQNIGDIDDHTMGQALVRYIDIKIHPLIASFTGKTIIVRGEYERNASIISSKEKNNKRFNWKRPTVQLGKSNQVLYVNCFPGVDYISHYTALIKAYLRLEGKSHITVKAEPPSEKQVLRELCRSNLFQMPTCDVVILGCVDRISSFFPSEWSGNGDFSWKTMQVREKKVALLGCKFSFWGDISAHIMHILALKGTKTVIYTGKLGGLTKNMVPNATLATGNRSTLGDQQITWSNLIVVPKSLPHIVEGEHITTYSSISETKSWLTALPERYSFVDPEIGHMADAAKRYAIGFSYVHLISDNVANMQSENLSNEREPQVLAKRTRLYSDISEILFYTITGLCSESISHSLQCCSWELLFIKLLTFLLPCCSFEDCCRVILASQNDGMTVSVRRHSRNSTATIHSTNSKCPKVFGGELLMSFDLQQPGSVKTRRSVCFFQTLDVQASSNSTHEKEMLSSLLKFFKGVREDVSQDLPVLKNVI